MFPDRQPRSFLDPQVLSRLAGVPLFARHRLIFLQDLFDPAQIISQLSFTSGFLLPVTWRFTVG